LDLAVAIGGTADLNQRRAQRVRLAATSSETWITTFSDGTTAESTDTNVYSLVNQAGTWLIVADRHPAPTPAQIVPGAGVQTPPAAQPTPQAPMPMVPVGPNTSAIGLVTW
jgi:hypothetical protein